MDKAKQTELEKQRGVAILARHTRAQELKDWNDKAPRRNPRLDDYIWLAHEAGIETK